MAKMSGRRKKESGRYPVHGGSLSPSIFGTTVSIQSFRLMMKVLKKPMPPLILGLTPDLSKVSKNLVQRNRGKLLESCEVKKEIREVYRGGLVLEKYAPDAVLVFAYITMTKGIYLTTKDRLIIEEAIALELRSAQYLVARMRKQRIMQLNHLKNILMNYKNGIAQDGTTKHGVKIRLFHTKKGKKRADKISRDQSIKRKKGINEKLSMSDEDKKFFAEMYMMLRLLHGPMKVRKMFSQYAPRINQKELIYWARLEGFCDSKDRPSNTFRQIMMADLRKGLTYNI
jgi:hypothetical protein